MNTAADGCRIAQSVTGRVTPATPVLRQVVEKQMLHAALLQLHERSGNNRKCGRADAEQPAENSRILGSLSASKR